jgi:hypothetical protein
MYQSEIFTRQRPSPALHLGILIADLHRRVQMIEEDIQAEEKRAKVFDDSSATYPVLARHLRLRRDNLVATISVLETRRSPAAA